MGDGDRTSKKITRAVEMENLSLDVSKSSSSRDLLQRFMGSSSDFGSKGAENEEIELNLGLSLGGRFGVDRNTDNLVRSSSIASCLPIARDDSSDVAGGGGGPPPPPAEGPAYSSLARTSSLPVETEEEWRKRKEMQSLRRLEAKRRRSEKQRNLRSERESLRSEREKESLISAEEKREIEVNVRGRLDREKSLNAIRRQGSTVGGGLAAMAAMIAAAKGKGSGYLGSQGSVESKGGSCSSDLESKTLQGSSGELSPASIQSLQEVTNQDIGSSTTKAREHTTRTESSSRRSTDVARNRGKEIGINALEDMPCVFTKGDGPNGRRIDGILYKYGKGEEVRIMCVCHGTFHSPAEFVRHAGGTDVDNPLKHIVVNPNSAPLV